MSKFQKSLPKLLLAIVLSLITAFSSITSYAASKSNDSVLYLEISNTFTAHDTFAWTAYDHYGYKEPYYSALNLPNHIIIDGDNIRMMGYGEVAYKDFLLVNDEENSRKVFTFDIQRDKTDWHSMEGGGFLFNASVKNNTLSGFCALITTYGLRLYEIPGTNVDTFRNGRSGSVSSYSKLLKTVPIGNIYAEHHIKIEVGKKSVSLWDGDTLLIDKYELPENDYGFGYGPITCHASHGCWQQSYFTFSNIKMQTVSGYYVKLEEVKDQWGLTGDYWSKTFTLTSMEYSPDEDEIIEDFSENALFKNTKDMILFYPDGSFERIPWANGKADYENADRYIDLFGADQESASILDLEPGTTVIGAYVQ